MALRVSGEAVTTTLTIQFTSDNVTTNYNADSTPTAEIYLDSSVISTLTGTDITNDTTGVYSITWTPDTAGQYKVVWSFTVAGIDYSQDEDIFVLDQASTSVTPTDEPDVGLASVCNVTGTFINSGGNFREGILVKFSPTYDPHSVVASRYVVDAVTSITDSDGQLSMYIMRGLTGLLTITEVGLSRRVTIPDKSSIDIFELASLGDDSFEVQTPQYYEAPRRS